MTPQPSQKGCCDLCGHVIGSNSPECQCECHKEAPKEFSWSKKAKKSNMAEAILLMEGTQEHARVFSQGMTEAADKVFGFAPAGDKKTAENVAMNIVYQLGDALYDALPKDVAHEHFVVARQATNDRLIDFATELIESLLIRAREEGFQIGRDEVFQADREQKSYERGRDAALAEAVEVVNKKPLPEVLGTYGPHDQLHIQYNIGYNAGTKDSAAALSALRESK